MSAFYLLQFPNFTNLPSFGEMLGDPLLPPLSRRHFCIAPLSRGRSYLDATRTRRRRRRRGRREVVEEPAGPQRRKQRHKFHVAPTHLPLRPEAAAGSDLGGRPDSGEVTGHSFPGHKKSLLKPIIIVLIGFAARAAAYLPPLLDVAEIGEVKGEE